MLVCFQDEFGGYSSRLRIQKNGQPSEEAIDECENNVDLNLCKLLGIDVDKLAYNLAINESN